VHDVKSFNPLVKAAYKANGWNERPGRQSADAEEKGYVPSTVRTYVTVIRRALRAGIRVATMKTFSQLRKAMRKATRKPTRRRPGLRGMPEAVKMNLLGVSIDAANEANGALIHDVGAVYSHLPGEPRKLFEKQLRQLLDRYMPQAKKLQVPEEQQRKAA
jgi:hypothetical protein